MEGLCVGEILETIKNHQVISEIDKAIQNPWLAIFLTLFFGVFGLYGLYVTIKGVKRKEPRYFFRSNNLVSGNARNLSPLKIMYKEKQINNVTVSKVCFWNNGNETCRREDIASVDPLCVSMLNKSEILQASIIFKKTDANNFGIHPATDNRSLYITFDYLDKNDGGIIQIVHTGKSSEDLQMRGTIIGFGEVNPDNNKSFLWIFVTMMKKITSKVTFFSKRKVLLWMCILMPVLVGVISFFQEKTSTMDVVFFFTITAAYWGMAYFLYRIRVPKGYEIFEENTLGYDKADDCKDKVKQMKIRKFRRSQISKSDLQDNVVSK